MSGAAGSDPHAERRAAWMTAGLTEADLDPDPLVQFHAWFEQVRDAGLHQPDAMALATAGPEGRPTVRMVLLRGADGAGFRFFTDSSSAKGRDLAANPMAALVFPWHALARQVRLAGPVHRLDDAEVDAYWSARPRGAQLAAAVSRQSEAVSGRAELEERRQALAERHEAEPVPRPPRWVGYRLVPDTYEYWQGREHRFHDRLRYRREGGHWLIERLEP